MNEKTNTEEVFQCICGKQFKTKLSLASHKSHCKIYLETLRQEKESRRLPNGLFKCENPDCENEHDGSYGSGRFCCKKCKSHYGSLKSAQTAIKNGNRKLPDKLAIINLTKRRTWKCKICGEVF